MAEIAISLSEADVARIADAVAERLAGMGSHAASPTTPEKKFWREPEGAAYLGISHAWLKKMRLRGYVMASTDSRPILYSREQLDAAAEFLLNHAAGAD